jgi:hypothetical protein
METNCEDGFTALLLNLFAALRTITPDTDCHNPVQQLLL